MLHTMLPLAGWVTIYNTPGENKFARYPSRWQQQSSHHHRIVRELGEHCAYKGDGGWVHSMDNSPNDKWIYITYGDINLLYPKRVYCP